MTVAFTVAVAFVLILSSSCRSFSFSPLACHSERSEESPHLPLRLPLLLLLPFFQNPPKPHVILSEVAHGTL
jgi:hypothetical protein